MDEYPKTLKGLSTPIYIAQHYKIKYQPDKIITAFQEAIAHYKTLVNKYSNSPIRFNLDSLIAQCYVEMKDWQNAINAFNNIIGTYKGKVNLDGILMQIALIYDKELKDKTKAKETLETLIKDCPNSRLTKTATALLKQWSKK